jgi:hypothetical protein
MSVTVQGSVPSDWNDQTAAHIARRLQALERAFTGASKGFVAPSYPSFGSGVPQGGTTIIQGGGGVTDHGALTGLLDDDHPQYAPAGQQMSPTPHQHNPDDVAGLEHRFLRRGESARALPHVHSAEEFGFDSRFYRRGERVPPEAHAHVELRPDDAQFVLASRMFGG